LSAVPSGTDTSSPYYKSKCTRINVPNYEAAKSIVYSSDGANQESCYLNLYNDDDCAGRRVINEGLNDDVSSCIATPVRYARLFCAKQVRARYPATTFEKQLPTLT